MDPTVILFGLGVGVLIGLTGIGGGSLMTPLLILFAGVPPTIAIGTDLAYGAVTKTVGGVQHWRKGTVDRGLSFWMALGSVPGSVVGVVLLELVFHAKPEALLVLVAAVLILVALSLLLRTLLLRDIAGRERDSVPLTRSVRLLASAIGAVLGVLLGLTSVGSGALIGFALILVFRLSPRRVVGTDVFHASLMLWAATFAHIVAGNIDYGLMATILIGSIPGVMIGTALIDRVPVAVLRPALACVLLGAGLGVATKAGLPLPSWSVLVVPIACALAFAVALRVLESRARLSTPSPSPTT